MRIKLLYFAKVKDLIKKSFDFIDINQTETINSDSIFSKIIEKENNLMNLKELENLKSIFSTCLLARNDEYIEKNINIENLKNNDEISIIPPISAG